MGNGSGVHLCVYVSEHVHTSVGFCDISVCVCVSLQAADGTTC